jgi:cytochrome P450 family 2 subfamily K
MLTYPAIAGPMQVLLTYSNIAGLMQVIADLFSAGSDTVSSSLKWVAFLLARYPDVAERLRQQIDDVVPRDETVSLLHKPK